VSSAPPIQHLQNPNPLPLLTIFSIISTNHGLISTPQVSSFHFFYSPNSINFLPPETNLSISCAAEAKRQLIAAGFHLLNENEEWNLKPGGRYFFTRNMSCLVAFAVGLK